MPPACPPQAPTDVGVLAPRQPGAGKVWMWEPRCSNPRAQRSFWWGRPGCWGLLGHSGWEDYTRPCPPPVARQGVCNRPRPLPSFTAIAHSPALSSFLGQVSHGLAHRPGSPTCADCSNRGEMSVEHIRYKTEHRQESLFKSLHRKQKEKHL